MADDRSGVGGVGGAGGGELMVGVEQRRMSVGVVGWLVLVAAPAEVSRPSWVEVCQVVAWCLASWCCQLQDLLMKGVVVGCVAWNV